MRRGLVVLLLLASALAGGGAEAQRRGHRPSFVAPAAMGKANDASGGEWGEVDAKPSATIDAQIKDTEDKQKDAESKQQELVRPLEDQQTTLRGELGTLPVEGKQIEAEVE